MAHAEIEKIFKAAGLAAHAAAAGVEKSHQDKVYDAVYVSGITQEILRTADKVANLDKAELRKAKVFAYTESKDAALKIIPDLENHLKISQEGARMARDNAEEASLELYDALDSQVADRHRSGAGPHASRAPQVKGFNTEAFHTVLRKLRGAVHAAHDEHKAATRTMDAAQLSLMATAAKGQFDTAAAAKKKLDDARAAFFAATIVDNEAATTGCGE